MNDAPNAASASAAAAGSPDDIAARRARFEKRPVIAGFDFNELPRVPAMLWAVIGLFVLTYAGTFWWMMQRWQSDPSATHGWLVIPIALVVTWYKRARLAALPVGSDKRGLLLMGVALFMHLAEVFFDINGPSPLSIPLFVTGAVWYFAGSAWLRELAFPISYLLFMVPIPGFLNQFVSAPLRQLATEGSKAIVEKFGIQINGAGMNMEFWRPGFDHSDPEKNFVSLVVADPCSGLHSLMAIKALHAITAYLSRLKLGWKWVLFMCALPISLAANVCRMVLIIMVCAHVDKNFGLKAFHDYSPYLLFIFVFAILISIGKFMEWATAKHPRLFTIGSSIFGAVLVIAACRYITGRFGVTSLVQWAIPMLALTGLAFFVVWFANRSSKRASDEAEAATAARPVPQRITASYVPVLACLVVALAFTGWLKLRPQTDVAGADVREIPYYLGEWKCVNENNSNSGLMEQIQADSYIMRDYQSARTGQLVQLYLVYRRYGRREFNHNPDQCFPAGGYRLLTRGTAQLPWAGSDHDAVSMTFDGTKVERTDGKTGVPNALVAYFFASGKRTESVFLKQQMWMALERLIPNKNGWTLVRLNTPWAGTDTDAQQAQREFMQAFGPEIEKVVTTDTAADAALPGGNITASASQ